MQNFISKHKYVVLKPEFMYRYLSFILSLLINCFSSCNEMPQEIESMQPSAIKNFSPISSAQSGISFNNTVIENDSFNTFDFIYVYNGGGVCIGDFNNDSLPDIFFTGNMVSSKLYLNKGGFHFEDITDQSGIKVSGWATGVTAVDINADGWMDFYVSRSGNYPADMRKNLLFINEGNNQNGVPVFMEKSHEYGLDDSSYSTQAVFFDYDKDGDLDLYLLNHTNKERRPNQIRTIINDGTGLSADKFYKNSGHQKFEEVSKSIGILHDGWGLGVAINDFNNDGWEDILVTNDFIADNFIYINNKNGTFSEKGKEYLRHFSHFSMGNDVADYNNDGLVDIFVNDMLPGDNFNRKMMTGPLNSISYERLVKKGYHEKIIRNTLHLNNGMGPKGIPNFVEIGQLAGINATDWSWGPLLADFDNDGLKDLYISTGFKRMLTDLDYIVDNSLSTRGMDVKSTINYIKNSALNMRSMTKSNYLFKNKGDLTFRNVTNQWGLFKESMSNGSAFADLDLDGDLDLVVSNIDEEIFIFKNNNPENLGYLQIMLLGEGKNITGLGTDIWLHHDSQIQFHHHSIVRGFQSSVDPIIHFGLGRSTIIDSLIVRWPDGKKQYLYSLKPNQRLTLYQNEAGSSEMDTQGSNAPFLTDVSKDILQNHKSVDIMFNDFTYQPLIPFKQSEYGPCLAKGDINGDGLDDFYVGGTFQNSGRVFIQSRNGNFKGYLLDHGKSVEEDGGCVFFDADSDGDLDLYVASGGGEFFSNYQYYQDRLYINDGQGQLSKSAGLLPKMQTSSSCVKPCDYDGDGDMDLFVGGRLQPLKYPMPGISYLLKNENGKFTDVTNIEAPGLRNIGMVTDAVWTDFNGDKLKDLVVVGEFMVPTFFYGVGSGLNMLPNQNNFESGWWNCITQGDFDEDGDPDFVLGNLGVNSRFHPTIDAPISVYASDLDNNGRLDPIMTYFSKGVEYAVHSLDDLIAQVPTAGKIFPNYTVYANSSFSEMISAKAIQSAFIVRMTIASSIYIENMGNGNFISQTLPIEAQFAPVQSLIAKDINGDNHLDIIGVGNSYSSDPVSGRYDALNGILLVGDGKGQFKNVKYQQSGFFANGDCRRIISMENSTQGNLLLVSRHNDTMILYKIN